MKKIIYLSTVACLYLGFFSFNSFAQNPGVLDASFNVGTGANAAVVATAIQSDGKIIIGGFFTTYNGTAVNRIARLNVDGTLDSTFTAGIGSGANGNVNAICILNDGSIIIGGNFTQINNCGASKVARLDINGGQYCNNWFITNCNGQVNSLALQNDGKIIVGGDFTLIGGSGIEWRGVTRIDINGNIDQSFISAAGLTNGANSSVKSVAVQSDGKIIVGGYFTTFNGVSKNKIARLNTNGSIDATFNTGTGFAGTGTFGVYCIKIQSDGKILVGGDFTSYNGGNMQNYGRLNSNGTRDNGFGTTISGAITSFSIQSDGKIIITGFFTNFGGTGINNLGRVATNGSVDVSFTAGAGASSTVFTSVIQNNGKIIIGGYFTSYNGTGVNRIARIMGDCTPPSAPTGQASQSFCANATISDLVATGSEIQWYSSSSGGTPLVAQTQLTSGTSYYASQTVTCASLSRLQVAVTINQPIDPTFNQLDPICEGATLNLANVSNNGITGIWSPAINNTTTTTYTFTPNSGQCANTQSMTVIVDPLTTPTFSQVFAICSGGTVSLPSVSNDNISGTWSPAINNTATTTYTFTPNIGQCGNTQTMTVAVNPPPTVTLTTFNSVCDTAGLVNLTGGSPTGGTYSGTSVSNDAFNTTIGIGSYPISYSYTNSNGCSSNATQNLLVIACTGSDVIELKENEIVLYPNPTSDAFTVETSEDLTGKSFVIQDVSGRVLSSGKFVGNKSIIQVSLLSSGTYYLNFPETNQTLKFIKQ